MRGILIGQPVLALPPTVDMLVAGEIRSLDENVAGQPLFGYSIDLTPDGTVLLVGAPGSDIPVVDGGCVYWCEGVGFATRTRVQNGAGQIGAGVGISVAVENSGVQGIVGANLYNQGAATDSGRDAIVTRVGITESVLHTIENGQQAGWHVAIARTAGAGHAYVSAAPRGGFVDTTAGDGTVFVWNGQVPPSGQWQNIRRTGATLDGSTNYRFGEDGVGVSDDGLTLVVGASAMALVGFNFATQTRGEVHLYTRPNTTVLFTHAQTLTDPTVRPADAIVKYFGQRVSISEDGNIVAVLGADTESSCSRCTLWIYRRVAGVWTLEYTEVFNADESYLGYCWVRARNSMVVTTMRGDTVADGANKNRSTVRLHRFYSPMQQWYLAAEHTFATGNGTITGLLCCAVDGTGEIIAVSDNNATSSGAMIKAGRVWLLNPLE